MSDTSGDIRSKLEADANAAVDAVVSAAAEAADAILHEAAEASARAEADPACAPTTGTQAALDALASDEGVVEVDAPSEESLTSAMPAFEDEPDDAGAPLGAESPQPRSENGGDDASSGSPEGGDEPDEDIQELDRIEQAAIAAAATASPSQTLPFAPIKPTSRTSPSASVRISGAARATGALAWGSRTDVGRVREHNEDSYVINFPLFAVADGMGGHAAGEVASTIAVSALAELAPSKPDSDLLGAAVEGANIAVLDGVEQGMGRAGMGTTCTSVIIDGTRMAVAHVGDSRAYLLHEGKLLRVTHDHSFVEELVEAGEITPEEARVHPSRSIITRALGSDRQMKADSFMVDVTMGDRVLLCSDGLSSMISDDVIEEAMVTSPAPQACADRLVDVALAAGGNDNVTVIVIDVKDDGIERHALLNRVRNVTLWLVAVPAVLAAIAVGMVVYADHTWYLSDQDGYVTLYKGIPGTIGSLEFSEEIERTSIRVSDLSETIEARLASGITFTSEDDARSVLEEYRSQIAQRSSSGSTAASSSDVVVAVTSSSEAQDASAATATEAVSATVTEATAATTEAVVDAEASDASAVPTTGEGEAASSTDDGLA